MVEKCLHTDTTCCTLLLNMESPLQNYTVGGTQALLHLNPGWERNKCALSFGLLYAVQNNRREEEIARIKCYSFVQLTPLASTHPQQHTFFKKWRPASSGWNCATSALRQPNFSFMQEQCKFLHLSNSEYCNWRSIYSKPSHVSQRLWLNAWINGGCRLYQIPGVRFHGTYFSGVVWSDVEFRALFIWCPTECLGVESRDSFPRHQAKSEKGTVVRPPFDAYSNVLSPWLALSF